MVVLQLVLGFLLQAGYVFLIRQFDHVQLDDTFEVREDLVFTDTAIESFTVSVFVQVTLRYFFQLCIIDFVVAVLSKLLTNQSPRQFFQFIFRHIESLIRCQFGHHQVPAEVFGQMIVLMIEF